MAQWFPQFVMRSPHKVGSNVLKINTSCIRREASHLCLALLLTACATPITQRPQFSPAELAQEQAIQHEAAIENPFPPIIEPVHPNKSMRNRLQAVAERISPQATKLCYEMQGTNVKCNFNIELKGTKGVNAYADGETVVFSGPMMEFARDDTHLAFVMAHELAHNMMRHIDSQKGNVVVGSILGALVDTAAATQGMNTQGGFSQIGANHAALRYSPEFEQEADYVGLYILARAGYDIDKAPYFWRAFSQYDPQGVYARSTHPSNPERFVAMNKTIAEIRAKERQKQPLTPNVMPPKA